MPPPPRKVENSSDDPSSASLVTKNGKKPLPSNDESNAPGVVGKSRPWVSPNTTAAPVPSTATACP